MFPPLHPETIWGHKRYLLAWTLPSPRKGRGKTTFGVRDCLVKSRRQDLTTLEVTGTTEPPILFYFKLGETRREQEVYSQHPGNLRNIDESTSPFKTSVSCHLHWCCRKRIWPVSLPQLSISTHWWHWVREGMSPKEVTQTMRCLGGSQSWWGECLGTGISF